MRTKTKVASVVLAAVLVLGIVCAALGFALFRSGSFGLDLRMKWISADAASTEGTIPSVLARTYLPVGAADVEVRFVPEEAGEGRQVEWTLAWEDESVWTGDGKPVPDLNRCYSLYVNEEDSKQATVICHYLVDNLPGGPPAAILKATSGDLTVERRVYAPMHGSRVNESVTDYYMVPPTGSEHPLYPESDTMKRLHALTQDTFLSRNFDGSVTSGWARLSTEADGDEPVTVEDGNGNSTQFSAGTDGAYIFRKVGADNSSYYPVDKDGSEASAITMKDIMRELYVVLDPGYTGYYSFLKAFPIDGLTDYLSYGGDHIPCIYASDDALVVSMGYSNLSAAQERAFLEAMASLPVLDADTYCGEFGPLKGNQDYVEYVWGKADQKLKSSVPFEEGVYSGSYYCSSKDDDENDISSSVYTLTHTTYNRLSEFGFFADELKLHMTLKPVAEGYVSSSYIGVATRNSSLFYDDDQMAEFIKECDVRYIPNGDQVYLGFGRSFGETEALRQLVTLCVLRGLQQIEQEKFDPACLKEGMTVDSSDLEGWINTVAQTGELWDAFGFYDSFDYVDSGWLDEQLQQIETPWSSRESAIRVAVPKVEDLEDGYADEYCANAYADVMNKAGFFFELATGISFECVPMSTSELLSGVLGGTVDLWLGILDGMLDPLADALLTVSHPAEDNSFPAAKTFPLMADNPFDQIRGDGHHYGANVDIGSYPDGSEQAMNMFGALNTVNIRADTDIVLDWNDFRYQAVFLWQDVDIYFAPKGTLESGCGYDAYMTTYRDFFDCLAHGFWQEEA